MTVNGSTVATVITGTPADYLVTYDPSSDLGYSQTITVTIDAQDLHSPANVMPRETYTFKTMAQPDNTPPATSGHSPAKGATDIPVSTNISLHVTDSGNGVSKSSILMTVNGSTVAPAITGTPADYLVAYDPPSDFGYSQTITVTIDAQDLHSPANVMPRETYTFKTMAQPDNTPPATSGHSPAKGAADVPVSTNISLHVTDSGDGVSKSSILMTVNGATVAPVTSGTPADYLVTYDPPSDFGYSQTITVTIDAQDLHSPPNVMPKETYTFRTAPRPDDSPPQTSGHSPTRGASNVPPDTQITLHITDAGKGVDRASIVVTVNGAQVAPTIGGTAEDYIVTYVPPSPFDYSQIVSVTVDARDLNLPPNIMPTDSYSFTIAPPPDRSAPSTSGHQPAKGAKGVPIDTTISFHISDAEDGVDMSSIVMTVNGYTVSPVITGSPADYLVTYDPPYDFGYVQTVTVTIDARDQHSPPNTMSQDRYTFITALPPEEDPAASDPNVFFFENFEDADPTFPKWDPADHSYEVGDGDLDIVQGAISGSQGTRVLQLGASRGATAGLVKHFALQDTVYCRCYARFGSGLNQGNLLELLSLGADSTGNLYKAADIYPKGADFFRSSLDFTTYWGRILPPGEAFFNTYYFDMKPLFYDADGDGSSELWWPANAFHSRTPSSIHDDGWHCVEMMIRANTPGLSDGEQAFWLDGQLVGYWSGLTWRLTDALKLNSLWLHMAVTRVSSNGHLWIDNIALSTQYIGPADASRDLTPVEIEALTTRGVGHSSAEISWKTNKPATSVLIYGAGENYPAEGGVIADTALVTDHRVKLKGVKSATEYHCQVVSRDATAGNEAVSGVLSFATLASSKGIFIEEWGEAATSNHLGTAQDTYISIPGFPPEDGKEAPAGPAESPTLYAYTFPAAKPATALLMKWDLSEIPSTAEILDAKLYLYMFDAGGDPDYSLSVHRVVGVDPIIDEATGNYYRSGYTWDPFSGLYDNTPLAQANIATADDIVNVGSTVNQYKEWNVKEMVAQWVLSPEQNFGLVINPVATASAGSYRYFRSSSHGDSSQRPRLVITCRVSRGQNLFWDNGAFVIQTEDFLADQYLVQSADELGGAWTNQTSIINNPWWHSGDLGPTRIKFFRLQTGF
jgi:hypothetical protein